MKSTLGQTQTAFPGDLETYGQIRAWSLAFQNQIEPQALAAIGLYARQALKELLSLSERGYKEALGLLVEILTTSVQEFDGYCRQELSHLPKNYVDYVGKRLPGGMDVRDFSRRQRVWPGLLSRDADLLKDNEQLVARLGLANEVGVNFYGKMWTRKNPAVSVALQLRNIVAGYRNEFQSTKRQYVLPGFAETANLAKTLAPLDRRSYRTWFKAAQPAFIKLYGKEFQDHPCFAVFREKGEKLSVKEQKKKRGLVRRAIKNAVCQAFKSIAPKSHSEVEYIPSS